VSTRTLRVGLIGSADDLFADPHDLVVAAAPNRHHVPLALRAIDAGMHVATLRVIEAARASSAERAVVPL
jgi:scyllo-inositol 2-dehydrogenase (NADP+)